MRRLFIMAVLLLPGTVCFAQAKAPATATAKDSFPSGHTTPEGVACDLARAFINRDAVLFKSTCLAPFGGGENRQAYAGFLKQMAQSIAAEKKKAAPSPNGPTKIDTVYAARYLSKNGPASYGYALFDFKDIQFVDVSVTLQNGKQGTNRTLVVQNADGRWYVHPYPPAAPLLSDGLNRGAASTKIIPRKP